MAIPHIEPHHTTPHPGPYKTYIVLITQPGGLAAGQTGGQMFIVNIIIIIIIIIVIISCCIIIITIIIL